MHIFAVCVHITVYSICICEDFNENIDKEGTLDEFAKIVVPYCYQEK